MARTRARVRPLYTGLRVRNLNPSIRFYKALGFRQTLRLRTSLSEFAQLERPVHRFTIELNRFNPGSWHYERYKQGSEMDHFGSWVDNVDATVKKLLKVGGKVKEDAGDCRVVIPPRPWFDGRGAMVADPDGIWIELMGPRKRRPSRRRRSGRPLETGPR